MIVNLIKRLFSGTVYVQLQEDRLRICHIEEGAVFDERPYIAIDKSNPIQKGILCTPWVIVPLR